MNYVEWMFRELRPVGEAISIRVDSRNPESTVQRYFPEPLVFFQSGTAALAAALIACKAARGVGQPEVLLPAYACPDLLSAVNFAGLQPVLVDFEENKPWMSIPDLTAKINDRTIAVIAVNFLGIPERIAEIRRAIDKDGVFIVEDRAQSLPENSEDIPSGDLVVLSFGKGKPVTLLHGGAIMIRNTRLTGYISQPRQSGSNPSLFDIKQYLKIAAYNLLIHPRCYWALKYIPMLRLGETRYKPLSAIESMKPATVAILGPNIGKYYKRKNMAAYVHKTIAHFAGSGVINLPETCGYVNTKLLRYPLLMPSKAQRNHCLRLLKTKGLGASTMYPGVLPAIEGVRLKHSANDYPNAAGFAARLLTLPLHSDVTAGAINEIAAVFRQCIANSHVLTGPK